MNKVKLYESPKARVFRLTPPLNLLDTLSADGYLMDFEEGEDL